MRFNDLKQYCFCTIEKSNCLFHKLFIMTYLFNAMQMNTVGRKYTCWL